MKAISTIWKRALLCAPALALAAALTACPDTPAPAPTPPAPPAPPAATLGALTVNVIGLPGGVNSSVTVSGPGGFSQAVSGTKTLEKLVPGSYTVASSNVTSAGATYAGTVTGSPVAVKAGATATASVSYAALTGVLNVNVTGLPAGVNAQFALTGPGGFNQNLTASQILPGMNLGAYTATPTPGTVRQPGSIVDAIFDGTPGSATVTAGAVSNLTASYAQRGGTGRLWLPLMGAQVAGYAASGLGGAAQAQPGVLTSSSGNPEAVAFDADGNMWVASSASHTLEKYTPSQLAMTGKVTPTVTISTNTSNFGALSNPNGLAFDKDGNLWVANLSNNTVVKFTSAQLAQSSSPLPVVTISSNSNVPGNGSLNQPNCLAFDRDGNLWVTNRTGAQPIVKYTPAQQAVGGVVTPAVMIGANNGSLNFPMGIAFDKDGNLWVANNLSNTVVMYLPVRVAASGSPAPDLTLTANGNSLKGPTGIAFDASGNLWVANLGNSTLVQFKGSTFLPAGGASIHPTTANSSPAPTLTIPMGNVSSAGFAFDPPPTNLPITQVK
jgi:sugar lactone lactonase YvrE